MSRGITLARWFSNEAYRIHALLGQSPEERDRRALLDWLQRHGGAATARDLCRSHAKKYPTMEAAEFALDQLATGGQGTWKYLAAGAQGGRPCRVLVLNMTNEPAKAAPDRLLEVVSAGVAPRIRDLLAMPTLRRPIGPLQESPTDSSVGPDADPQDERLKRWERIRATLKRDVSVPDGQVEQVG